MDQAPIDLLRRIAEFSDSATFDAVKVLSKDWKRATNDCPVHVEGPVNGDTFSIHTLMQNGPVFMPYVVRLDLSGFAPNHVDVLVAALKALNIPKITRPITVFATHAVLGLPEVCQIIQGIRNLYMWAYLDPPIECDLVLSPSICHMSALAFGLMDIRPRDKICLMNYMREADANEACRLCVAKAFSCGARDLCFFGTLTDQLIQGLDGLPDLLHVEILGLHHQGILTWCTWPTLMRKTPNVWSLSITGSNLVFGDFEYFDWSLWPYLTSLDLEENWTLQSWPRLPVGLKHLGVANTGLVGPSLTRVDDGLESLSCNLASMAGCFWKAYFKRRPLKCIKVCMTVVTGHEVFWTHLHTAESISILIDGAAGGARRDPAVLERIRKVCPSAFLRWA